jgi:hypothetical protein
MKHTPIISWLLSASVLLCGCGGGRTPSQPVGPPPLFLKLAGNWQFSMTSTTAGTSLTVAGIINQTSTSVSGAVHVNGSDCFDSLTTIALTGTLTGSSISLSSTSVVGQVVTLTGTISDDAFIGTYTIKGGCASGYQGKVTGIKVPPITGTLNGTFAPSGDATFNAVAHFSQGITSSVGTFGLTGTVTFATPCFGSGTLKSRTFPSGSFIMGTSVALEIESDNGIVNFVGTVNPDTGEIRGDYVVSGGTCDQAGTAVLDANPWDY